MARNEAVILPVNCVSAHKTYYARYDYAYDEVWQRERDTSQLYIQKTCQKISMNYIMCGKAIQKTSVKR